MSKWFISYILVLLFLIIVFQIGFGVYTKNNYYELAYERLSSNLEFYAEYTNTNIIFDDQLDKNTVTYIVNNNSSNYYLLDVLDSEHTLLSTHSLSKGSVTFPVVLDDYFISEYHGQKLMVMYSPLLHKDKTIGYLRLISGINQLDNYIKRDMMTSLGLSSIVMLIITIVSLIFILSIVRPINKLVKLTERYAAGHLDDKVIINTKDELEKLGDSMMFMADKIKITQAEKSKFVSSISHELRTPLTSILGWCELIESGNLKEKEDIISASSTISSEARRLTGLLNTLIDFNRGKGTDIQFKRRMTNFAVLVDEVVNLYTPKLSRFDSMININIDRSIEANLDADKIKQVIVNLLDNSIKYSNKQLIIDIDLYREDEKNHLIIKDNGPGIPNQDLDRIKESFYRVKHTKEGLGLGLSISDDIISAHGGTLKIDSELGQGTTITIII